MHEREDHETVRRGRPEAALAVWRWRDTHGPDAAGASDAAARSALRREGLVRAVVGLLVGTAFLLWWHLVLAVIVLGIATFTLLAALLSPGGLYRRLHRATEVFGHGVGIAIGWVLLPLFFFVFLTPLALLMRIGNPDRLHQRRDPRRASYWTPRDGQRPHDRHFYERQF